MVMSRPYSNKKTPLTTAERIGYHRAWMKRMHHKIRRTIVGLECERTRHLMAAEELNVAILTMRRMLTIRFQDVKSKG